MIRSRRLYWLFLQVAAAFAGVLVGIWIFYAVSR